MPSAVFGPVDSPPCRRQRVLPLIAGSWQGDPARVFAPHLCPGQVAPKRVARPMLGSMVIMAGSLQQNFCVRRPESQAAALEALPASARYSTKPPTGRSPVHRRPGVPRLTFVNNRAACNRLGDLMFYQVPTNTANLNIPQQPSTLLDTYFYQPRYSLPFKKPSPANSHIANFQDFRFKRRPVSCSDREN